MATCYIGVFAPSVTNLAEAKAYRPLDRWTIEKLLTEAASGAKQSSGPLAPLRYDGYDIFPLYFYGGPAPNPATAAELSKLPSVLLDCASLGKNGEPPDARERLRDALELFYVPKLGTKRLFKIPRGEEACVPLYTGQRVTSDVAFLAILESDLWGHPYAVDAEGHP